MIVRFYINKVETENTNDNVIGGLNVDYFSLITSENTMNEMICSILRDIKGNIAKV